MVTVILLGISFVCGIGWLVNYVGLLALAKWIIDKGLTPPTGEEMSQCVTYVWRKLLRIK